jgi:hypothetical protein
VKQPRIIAAAIAAVVLAGLAVGLHHYRKAFIQSFFVRGPGGAAAPALAKPDGVGLSAVPRVRVVLLDGVGLDGASKLPGYSLVCDAGLDLIVDTGFPTVSLPVQSVLWTGLTQQQTGIQYVWKPMEPPPGIPGDVEGSIAVAETHPYIVHSLGFAETHPSTAKLDAQQKEAWNEQAFVDAAERAVTSDSKLVLVHVLRADTAGHKHGGDSDEYRRAEKEADQILERLYKTDEARAGDTRWFVLSDHGHLPGGGHAGAEPYIRFVRACVAGGALPEAKPPTLIHLVDLSRAVADSTGVAANAASAGRPLESAIAAPVQSTATLPHPAGSSWLIACLLMLLAIIATMVIVRRHPLLMPMWLIVAYVSVALVRGMPTLSMPMIYKPLGLDIAIAAIPGLVVLAVTLPFAIRAVGVYRAVWCQFLVPLAAVGWTMLLCKGSPPLMPLWTAQTSVFLVLLFSACAVAAPIALVFGALPWSDRESPAESEEN